MKPCNMVRGRGDFSGQFGLNGNYVGVTETAHQANELGEEKSQSALTVYELKDNLVRRVYYYPQTPEQID